MTWADKLGPIGPSLAVALCVVERSRTSSGCPACGGESPGINDEPIEHETKCIINESLSRAGVDAHMRRVIRNHIDEQQLANDNPATSAGSSSVRTD